MRRLDGITDSMDVSLRRILALFRIAKKLQDFMSVLHSWVSLESLSLGLGAPGPCDHWKGVVRSVPFEECSFNAKFRQGHYSAHSSL